MGEWSGSNSERNSGCCGTDETLNQLIDYFTKTVVPQELSPALKDEMLDVQELIRDCENLGDNKKKQLLKYY